MKFERLLKNETYNGYDVTKLITFLPKRVTSGRIVWFGYFYRITKYKSVDRRHLWLDVTELTESEYFIKKLSE